MYVKVHHLCVYLYILCVCTQAHAHIRPSLVNLDKSTQCYPCTTKIDAIALCPMEEEWEGVLQFGTTYQVINCNETIISVTDKKVLVVHCGIGPSSSCGYLGRLLIKYPYTPVCLIGVAGSVSPYLNKGDVIVPRKWLLINSIFSSTDHASSPYTKTLAYRKINNDTYQILVASNDANKLAEIVDINYGIGLSVSSADLILTDDSREFIAQTGANYGETVLSCDMESGSLASVCLQYGLAATHFAAIRVISDDIHHQFNPNDVPGLISNAYPEFIRWLNRY